MINIEESRLCAFDEDGFLFRECVMEQRDGIGDTRDKKLRRFFPFFRNFFPEETLHSLPMSRSFIGISGSDAALRCADPSPFPCFFECGIPLLMLFRHNVCRTGNFEPWEHIDSCFFQSLYFLKQRRQMNHHPTPEDDCFSFMQRSCGEQVEDVLFALNNDRVSGIRSTTRTCEDVKMRRQEINELPFALISPLCADDGGDIPEAFQELLHMCSVPELLLCVESLEV